MATVPGVVLITDYHGRGGRSGPVNGIDSAAAYSTLATYDQDLHRVFPDDASTGAPTAAALGWFPWFDTRKGTTYVVASAPAPSATRVYVDGSPGWTTDEWAGFKVCNSNSTGFGWANTDVVVTANGANYLDVAAWTGATPLAGSGIWLNEGAFTDYAVHKAWRTITEVLGGGVPTRGGSSALTPAGVTADLGIGGEGRLLRYLHENVFTAPPYFQLAKWFTTSPIVGGYDDTTGADRAAFLTEKGRWDAAFTALATGNTLSYEHIIIDLSQRDVLDWQATPANVGSFSTHLTEMIAWLRSAAVLNNSTAKVYLVCHDERLRLAAAPSATTTTAFANALQRLAAVSGSNIRTVELGTLGLRVRGADATSPTWAPGDDPDYYITHNYTDTSPRAYAQAIESVEAGTATGSSAGQPFYVMLGDSITSGRITDAYVTALDSPTLTGTSRGNTQRIYNGISGAGEAYDFGTNSNTLGTADTQGGPEFSLLPELAARHAASGAYLLKRGSGGSCLIADYTPYSGGLYGRWARSVSGEHWDALETDAANAVAWANTVLGKQAELLGIFVNLGTNDALVAGGGALFAAALPQFCIDLRSTYGTHANGKATPIVWRLPQLGTANRIYDEMVAIRAALRDYAETDAQFVVMDVDDLERESDDVHPTDESTIIEGRRYDTSLGTIAYPNCAVD